MMDQWIDEYVNEWNNFQLNNKENRIEKKIITKISLPVIKNLSFKEFVIKYGLKNEATSNEKNGRNLTNPKLLSVEYTW